MKYLPTTVLLDLAEDYQTISQGRRRIQRESAILKLDEIDTELLSRMPEFSYVTVLDGSGNPIGFEPYIGEDNSHCYHEWNERYFGSVCYKCGAMKPLDGSMFIDEDCP